MIDWKKSAEFNNMTVDGLRARFEKFPQSHKKIIVSCDGCGEIREIRFRDYRELCLSCAESKRYENPKEVEMNSKRRIEYWSDQKHRDEQSKKITERWLDRDYHHKLSEIMKNSEIHKNQIGGNDIVKHHYIYDESDLSKYTIEMIRSKHTQIHAAMRKEGIEVPHINIRGGL